MHCSLCIIFLSLYYMYCILRIVFFTVYAMHCILCTVLYTKHIIICEHSFLLWNSLQPTDQPKVTVAYRAAIIALKKW